jgi:membrane associated rhomboid family serine protease
MPRKTLPRIEEMLIIPLTGKFSWKNLPVLTILLILINCAVYFTAQSDDHSDYGEAMAFYFKSGLADIEIERYVAYRETQGSPLKPVRDQRERKQIHVREMMNDDAFQALLLNDGVIFSHEAAYGKWKDLRLQHDAMLQRITSVKYGFIPARHEPVTVLTHMFMHGSFMHLLGNMAFLWLVGCVLEIGLGRFQYMVLYLLGGICATALFYLFNMNSLTPLIGASGAISGLMGAYTVAYGKTKINIFYSLGFYFNYTRVYAILLLPLWIGYEVFQYFYFSGSNVAYMAHVGGLIGGASIGLINMKLLKKEEHKIFEENPAEKIPFLLEQALKKIEMLDLAPARIQLLEILAIDPMHGEALKHLFNIDKLQPAGDVFHQTASKRIAFLCRESEDPAVLYDTFREYCRIVKTPRMNADLLLRVSVIFARAGNVQEAENLVHYVLSIAPNHPRLLAILLDVATLCGRTGDHACREKIHRTIMQHYPDTPQAARISKDDAPA